MRTNVPRAEIIVQILQRNRHPMTVSEIASALEDHCRFSLGCGVDRSSVYYTVGSLKKQKIVDFVNDPTKRGKCVVLVTNVLFK